MTVGFYLLRFVRLIADLIGGHRTRLDPVSLELKFINGNGNTPCANAEKAAHINLDFAVRESSLPILATSLPFLSASHLPTISSRFMLARAFSSFWLAGSSGRFRCACPSGTERTTSFQMPQPSP